MTYKSSRYIGMVCSKHRDLGGHRNKSGQCMGCVKDKSAVAATKRRLSPAKTPRYTGTVCTEHPELNGLRYWINGSCVSCALEAKRRYAAKKASDPSYRFANMVRARARRAGAWKARPKWASWRSITEAYLEAHSRGLSVDHIVPLRHPLVSGLHCPDNFQYLPLADNVAKGNNFVTG